MIKIYHYTSRNAFKKMENKGLIPKNPVIYRRMFGLPEKAYQNVICGLLNPSPKEWKSNKDFPLIWNELQQHLNYNIGNDEKLLLNFEINKKDEAYVLDRKYLEQKRELIEKGEHPIKEHIRNCKDFFESRIPILEYEKGYSLPEIIIYNKIEFDRLNIEKINKKSKLTKKIDKMLNFIH